MDGRDLAHERETFAQLKLLKKKCGHCGPSYRSAENS